MTPIISLVLSNLTLPRLLDVVVALARLAFSQCQVVLCRSGMAAFLIGQPDIALLALAASLLVENLA
jgi:hypothetical protein